VIVVEDFLGIGGPRKFEGAVHKDFTLWVSITSAISWNWLPLGCAVYRLA
jgi:hypothetical protein